MTTDEHLNKHARFLERFAGRLWASGLSIDELVGEMASFGSKVTKARLVRGLAEDSLSILQKMHLAHSLDVEPLWLFEGIGEMSSDRIAARRQAELDHGTQKIRDQQLLTDLAVVALAR